MNQVFAAAAEIQRFCEERSWRFCIIGGLALQRWGEPRQTFDADLTLLTGFGGEEAFIEALTARFGVRMPDAAAFALKTRVLLLAASNGVHLDVSLGAMPFEERSVERSSVFAVSEGVALRTCSAEDLLVHKVFAGRDKDWMDVRGVLVRQKGRLNVALVREELRPLLDLKGTPEALERFEKLLADSVS